jgi:hypothetical protein
LQRQIRRSRVRLEGSKQTPLSIKNKLIERLAHHVADATGESITEAIQKSLEERLERLKARRNRVLA